MLVQKKIVRDVMDAKLPLCTVHDSAGFIGKYYVFIHIFYDIKNLQMKLVLLESILRLQNGYKLNQIWILIE